MRWPPGYQRYVVAHSSAHRRRDADVFRRKKKKAETLRVLDPLAEGSGLGPSTVTPACMTIYLAAEGPLPLVEWRAEAPGFYLADLETENDELVRVQFTSPHVYCAGSHSRCGCGFNYGRIAKFERDPEEMARKRHSLAAMSEYLAHEIGRVGEIELFACWDGDQAADPEIHRDLTPSSLLSERFFFYEKELSVVREDAA